MTGLFQFTVRMAIETEARFTSVERLSQYEKVKIYCMDCFIYLSNKKSNLFHFNIKEHKIDNFFV